MPGGGSGGDGGGGGDGEDGDGGSTEYVMNLLGSDPPDSGGTTQPCTTGGDYYSLPTLTLYTSSIDIDWSIIGNYLIAKD